MEPAEEARRLARLLSSQDLHAALHPRFPRSAGADRNRQLAEQLRQQAEDRLVELASRPPR